MDKGVKFPNVETTTKTMDDKLLWWLGGVRVPHLSVTRFRNLGGQPPEGHASIREAELWLKSAVAAGVHAMWSNIPVEYVLMRSVLETRMTYPD